MTVAEILNKAADLIEERGWYPGAERAREEGIAWKADHTGPTCAAVAIEEVDHPDSEAYHFFRRSAGIHHMAVMQWNDEQADGQAVIDALRKAAREAEAS